MEKGHFLKGKNNYAVSLSNGNYILDTGDVITESVAKQYNFRRTCNKEVRESLLKMAKIHETLVKTQKEMQILKKSFDENSRLFQTLQKGLTLILKETPNKKIKGTENIKMSFYDGTLNIPFALAILKKNNRPLYYRFGFGYRGATKREITKEEAISILEENKYYTDFLATDDEVLINQYSENDMF